MLSQVALRRFGVVLLVTMLGCQNNQLEREFFRQPLDTRVERLRQYPLEAQYKIFRYGNDVVHPPLTNLAVPIAERGSAAVPFLMAQLQKENDDFSIRDILLIVQEMKRLNTHAVKSDEALVRSLTENVESVKDKEWRATCSKMLDEVKSE
jgi:hypothetical protein